MKLQNAGSTVIKPKTLNDLLSPILTTVKRKRINSFHQLKNTYQIENPQSVFTDKQQNTNLLTPRKKMNKTLLNENKKSENQTLYEQTKRKNFTTNTGHRKFRSEHPTFPKQSKLKKHLVETINFKEIENKLYKRRQWTTRFEHFCEQLKSKKTLSLRMQENIHKKSSFPCKSRTFKPQMKSNYETMVVRAAPKKKFWIRQRNHKIKQEENNYLQGVSFGSISNL